MLWAIGAHNADDTSTTPPRRDRPGYDRRVHEPTNHPGACGPPRTDEPAPAGLVFLLPQGLTVTGVNTWARSVVKTLRARGRPAWAIVHGGHGGHREITDPESSGLIRLDLPPAEDVRDTEGVAVWGRAYTNALRRCAHVSGGRLALIPTRHDACFAAGVWASTRSSGAWRVVLWQQLDSRYEDALLEHFEPGASALVGASALLARSLADRFPHRRTEVVCIPNAVEVPDALPDRGSCTGRAVRVLYTGRVEHEQKRVLALLHLSDTLDSRGVPHELRVVGDGPALAELRGMSASRSSVSLTGALDGAGVRRELERADVFVLASRNEGLSYSLLEAMAHGCAPVLTRTRSGSDEAVEHGVSGWIVDGAEDDRATGEALADGVEGALGLGLATIGQAARARVRDRYSLSVHCDSLEELCGGVVAGSTPAWPAQRPLLARGARGGDAAAAERAGSILAQDLGRRFVIHGAGGHTRRLLGALRAHDDRILALADDERSLWGRVWRGWRTVIDPAEAASLGATDVLISSDLHEDSIWDRREIYQRQGLRVHRLYASLSST